MDEVSTPALHHLTRVWGAIGQLRPNAMTLKDLRLRMRSSRPAVAVTAEFGLLSLEAIGYLIRENGSQAGESTDIAVQLFQLLAASQLMIILVTTPTIVAAGVSGERQHRTWELLTSTPLSSFAIVWGKLLGSIAFSGLLLVAALPVYSVAISLGGMGPKDAIRVGAVFVTTIALITVAGLLISTLSATVSISTFWANLVSASFIGLAVLVALLNQWQGHGKTGQPGLLTPLAEFDPLVALACALPNGTGGSYLGSLGLIHHAFGLPVTIHLWSAYVVLAMGACLVMLALTARCVRRPPFWVLQAAA